MSLTAALHFEESRSAENAGNAKQFFWRGQSSAPLLLLLLSSSCIEFNKMEKKCSMEAAFGEFGWRGGGRSSPVKRGLSFLEAFLHWIRQPWRMQTKYSMRKKAGKLYRCIYHRWSTLMELSVGIFQGLICWKTFFSSWHHKLDSTYGLRLATNRKLQTQWKKVMHSMNFKIKCTCAVFAERAIKI